MQVITLVNDMPTQAQREGGGIAPPIRNLALDGGRWSTPLSGPFTPGKDLAPIAQEAGWASGPVWTARKIYPTGSRSLDRPARCALLYRLRYPGRLTTLVLIQCRYKRLHLGM